MMNHFSCFLSSSLALDAVVMMRPDEALWIYPTWSLLSFLYVEVNVFSSKMACLGSLFLQISQVIYLPAHRFLLQPAQISYCILLVIFFPSVWVTLFNFMTFFLVSFYNFFPHWLPLCETPFPYCHLDMTSFSPLYIFKIADLKYLSSNSGFWASSGTVSVHCFPLPWYFLMVSLYVSKFLSKTGHSKEYNVAALEMRSCPVIGFVTVAA